jgi:hypothetical protein
MSHESQSVSRKLSRGFVTGIAVCLVLVSSAFGQLDATTLRAKYGEPIKYGAPVNSEAFKARNNLKMVVNYGARGQVCRIEAHPTGQSTVRQAPPDGGTKQQVDEALQEVVPPSMRGKEIRSGVIQMGAVSFLLLEYEHVTITELLQNETPTSFTVAFKQEGCR